MSNSQSLIELQKLKFNLSRSQLSLMLSALRHYKRDLETKIEWLESCKTGSDSHKRELESTIETINDLQAIWDQPVRNTL